MTNDRHHRIWADGYVENLEAIWDFYGYNPKIPGSGKDAKAAAGCFGRPRGSVFR